jgi:hypothetical protein
MAPRRQGTPASAGPPSRSAAAPKPAPLNEGNLDVNRKLFAMGAAAALFAVILAGCGGSQGSAISQAAAAKYDARTKDVSCSKAGIMLFVGARATVYACTISGVPPAARPIKHLTDYSLVRCFVRANGDVFEVTDQIVALEKLNGQDLGCR